MTKPTTRIELNDGSTWEGVVDDDYYNFPNGEHVHFSCSVPTSVSVTGKGFDEAYQNLIAELQDKLSADPSLAASTASPHVPKPRSTWSFPKADAPVMEPALEETVAAAEHEEPTTPAKPRKPKRSSVREYIVIVDHDPPVTVLASSVEAAGIKAAEAAGFEPSYLQKSGLRVRVRAATRKKVEEFYVYPVIHVEWGLEP